MLMCSSSRSDGGAAAILEKIGIGVEFGGGVSMPKANMQRGRQSAKYSYEIPSSVWFNNTKCYPHHHPPLSNKGIK